MKKPVAFLLLVLLTSCGDAPKPETKKEPEAPPEPVTGRYAFHQMFASARTWAPDIQALNLVSLRVQGVKEEPGKAGAWTATFLSPSRGRAKTFSYSVVDAGGNLHKGVFGTPEDTYTPRGQAKPFHIQALKVDTDAAYETAAKKGQDYIKKNPDKPILFLLEHTRFPNPAWRVIWGESVSTSNFSIYVDATTGEYLQTMR
jgi:hypothetical protein